MISYIKENKIIVLLIIIICFIAYFYYYPYNTNKIEKMTAEETTEFVKNIANKYVYITCIKDGETLYLGSFDSKNCITINGKSGVGCPNDIAVLQKEKGSRSVFKINTLIGEDAYFISSIVGNTILTHNVNAASKPNPYLCFSMGNNLVNNKYTIETVPTGYVFVYTRNSQKYYISECGITALCKYQNNLYYKLCLNVDKAKAVIFNFMAVDVGEQLPKPTTPAPTPESEHIESFDNVSLFSNISLLSQSSNCDTNSLPGPGDGNGYASWDDASIL